MASFWFAAPSANAATSFTGSSTPVLLARGSFPVWNYAPATAAAGDIKGFIVFGSGDGGWTKWEERVCRSLANNGYLLAGVDSKRYADHPYDWKILASDYRTIARSLIKPDTSEKLPLIYGGFSTGAEQSTAAAAYSLRPENLKYLLLVAPGKRGRFGMTLSDLMGLTPKGPGTFALADYADTLTGLRIAQFHGEHDPLDSTDWLQSLKTPHKLFITPGGWHTYHGADSAFINQLMDAMTWLTGNLSSTP